MLKEIAIADAYGAGFEFSTPEKILQHNHLTQYQPHELYQTIGKYTDDTQMSVAVAEVMLKHPAPHKLDFANAFVNCFKRDVRSGYAEGFYNLLLAVDSGQALLDSIRPNSERNGAAMRAVPLGLYADKQRVIDLASIQASITHHTEAGIASSVSVALAAHFGLHHKGTIKDLADFLQQEGFLRWDLQWNQPATVLAFDTLSAALSCLLRNQTLSDLLKDCIRLGGDTDSVAAIAVGIASCYPDYSQDFPAHLWHTLDEPHYGLSFLAKLDESLQQQFLPRHPSI